MKEANQKALQAIDDKIKDAEENLGDIEVRDANRYADTSLKTQTPVSRYRQPDRCRQSLMRKYDRMGDSALPINRKSPRLHRRSKLPPAWLYRTLK